VAACTVEKMTGAPEIGPYACRAIQERYRYEPARDAEGRNVASVMFENHAWGVERRRSIRRQEP
jgi:protein TonB